MTLIVLSGAWSLYQVPARVGLLQCSSMFHCFTKMEQTIRRTAYLNKQRYRIESDVHFGSREYST